MKSNILFILSAISVALSAYLPIQNQDFRPKHIESRQLPPTDTSEQLPAVASTNNGNYNGLLAGQPSNEPAKILGSSSFTLSQADTELLKKASTLKVAMNTGAGGGEGGGDFYGPRWNPNGEPVPGGGYMFRFNIPGPGGVNAPSSGSLGPTYSNHEQGLFDYITEQFPTDPGDDEFLSWVADQFADGVFSIQQFSKIAIHLTSFWGRG